MNYTILKQWKTLDGTYHSSSLDKSDYDIAIGDFHAMFKPMQNDTNVASFILSLIDENGVCVTKCGWERQTKSAEEEEPSEVNE